MKQRRTLSLALGGLLLALAAWGCRSRPPVRPAEDGAAPIKRVRVARVEVARETRDVRFSGVVRAAERARLSFPLGARLAERPVDLGDGVARGRVVARLDPRETANAVAVAAASLDEIVADHKRVKQDLERVERLSSVKAATGEELDRARRIEEALAAAAAAAEIRLREARRLRAETILVAPFAGTVTAVGAEPGEIVRAGQTVLTVSGGGALEVEVGLPESMAARLVAGAPVKVELPLAGGRSLSGRVERVGRATEAGGSLFPAVIGLPAASELLPGMTAEVVLEVGGEGSGLLAVPLAAVLNPGGRRPVVFRLDGERVTRVEVAVEALIDDRVAVSGDLEPGAEVVVTGHTSLLDGDTVEAIR